MRDQLTEKIVFYYRVQQLFIPMLCTLLCLPCLLLAYWNKSLLKQGDLILYQLKKNRKITQPLKKKKIISSTPRFLWNQFIVLSHVFEQGGRINSVDWNHSVLTINGEAGSVAEFSTGWDAWMGLEKAGKLSLMSFSFKKHPFFRVFIRHESR